MTAPKYSLEVPEAKIGKDGFSTTDGWLTTYNCDTRTLEYTGARQDYLQIGLGLAAGAYTDVPTLPTEQDKAVRRKEDGSAWEIVDDFRGLPAYNTETQQKVIIDYLGPLEPGWTLIAPTTTFDKWDGEKWVTDTDAQKKSAVASAQSELDARMQEADATISQLERAVKLDMATEDEKARLTEWEKYSVLLSRINPDDAPKIDWPPKPE
jgi:hypothetical protein